MEASARANPKIPAAAASQQQQQQPLEIPRPSLSSSPKLGEERDRPESDYAELKDAVIRSIRDLRADPDMCDVTFLVGLDPATRVEIRANSTILSLRSPYFKVSPLRVQKRGSTVRKAIQDISGF